ncbi:MAG: phosphoglucosamine mutase, partial [Clostridia bacterium]|nr:phosphoglucosamine mutase [Clostridia bacterium]
KKSAMENGELLKLQKKIENELSGHGRLLIRESGTEPVIRIMVECESEEKCKAYCKILARTVEGG